MSHKKPISTRQKYRLKRLKVHDRTSIYGKYKATKSNKSTWQSNLPPMYKNEKEKERSNN
jgi:hypothetical protein